VIPTKEDQPSEQIAFLDPRVLQTPSIALGECVSMSHKMGKLAQANLKLSMEQMDEYTDARAAEIAVNEEHLDLYDDRLGKYLVEISRQGISEKDMRTGSRLLHIIGNFERIGDHAVNLQSISKDIHDKGQHFSEPGTSDLKVLRKALEDISKKSFVTFRVNCSEGTREVEPLEEAIDQLTDEIRKRHVRRMQRGGCSIELSWHFNETLVSMERISDLCSNVAFFTSKAADRHPDRHSYRLELRHKGEFSALLFEALEKYKLPSEK
ncbi:MAG: Na/Pi cotransporter family protein, partial [Clostridium sp.]|nr:Na/Pi cotransporter family protein [Clostridium sp.]